MPARRARDETDEFIYEVTGRDPYARSTPSPDTKMRKARDPIPKAQGFCSERCTGAGCFLTVLNVLLLLAGAFLITVGIMAKSNSHFNNVCSACEHGAIGVIVLGTFVLLMAIAGMCAALALSVAGRCLGGFYVFTMFIFALVGLSSVVLVILLKENKLDNKIRDAWNDAAKSNPHDVCDAQDSLKCSGWEALCEAINGTVNTTGCPVDCGSHPEYNNYTETCHDKIHDKVDSWFPWLMIGTVAFFLVTSMSCCLSTKTVCDPNKGKRDQGYSRINQPVYA